MAGPVTRLTSVLPSADRVPTGVIYGWAREGSRGSVQTGLTPRKVIGILGLTAFAAIHVVAAKAGFDQAPAHMEGGIEGNALVDTAMGIYDYAYAAGHAAIALVQARIATNLFMDRNCPEPNIEGRNASPLAIGADVGATVASQAVFMIT